MTQQSDVKQGQIHLCDYPGAGDWRLDTAAECRVRPYERLAFSVETLVEVMDPAAELFACIRVHDHQGRTLRELFAPVAPDYARKGWQTLSGRFVVPAGASSVNVRLWGQRAVCLRVTRPTLKRLSVARFPSLKPVTLINRALKVTLAPDEWHFTAQDRRNGYLWQTFPACDAFVVTGVKRRTARQAVFSAIYLPADAPLTLTVTLDAHAPQFSLHAAMPSTVRMPSWAAMLGVLPAFYGQSSSQELVVPLGEGFLYPTQKPDIPAHILQLSDGSGLTMPWFGIADRKTGVSAMCFTRDEDDALARLYYRKEGKRAAGMVALEWMSQHGRWGYNRTATYWFADKGGYVVLCKRYRQEAARNGRLVTLAEKRRRLPQIDRLLGAPNCWFNFLWHKDKRERMGPLRWLREQGMDRLLLSNSDCLEDTGEVDRWGWLTGQYDLYSDVWPAEQAAKANSSGRTFGYPDLIQVRYTHQKVRGWVQKTKHGEFPGYVLCPTCHLRWAKERVPPTLKARTQTARLIDTTTALPLGECYHPNHPMTRAQDKAARLALLRYMRDQKLIVGSEIGADWAMPFLCYSEGMLSPTPYRHPEAGYLKPDMTPTQNTYQYQLNPAVRVPLWELVYHDCSVAYWYWGDATNTFPKLWPRRNAFNALYVTPPLYMILQDENIFLAQRDRIVATDRFLKPLFKAVGFAAMTDHRFLSTDRLLQQTKFANGVRVTVNFTDTPRRYAGTVIPAGGYRLETKRGERTMTQNIETITLTPSPVEGPTRRRPGMKDGDDLARIAFQLRAPWMEGPIELRFPEVLQSALGFHFLDHFRETIHPLHELDAYPIWKLSPATGGLSYTCKLHEGVTFRGEAVPEGDTVRLEFRVTNETGKPLEYLSSNMCLHLGGSPEFGQHHDLSRLFIVNGGALFPLSKTTPTAQEMQRELPWLLMLTRQGVKSFTGPKVSPTWWRVEQVAEENLMTAVSKDGKYLVGYAWDLPAETQMTNGGNPCLHTGPGVVRQIAPGTSYTWRGKVYFVPNDPARLLARYWQDKQEWETLMQQEKNAAMSASEARPPTEDADLRFWLENILWYHRYSPEEISSATGLAVPQVAQELARLNIRPDNRPHRRPDAPLTVLPYPGGRHPRIGFLDGAINPQRETKVSVFTPWDENSYVVVDVPEAIFTNLGLTYLAHTHVPTLWTQQNITLPRLEWNRHKDGMLEIERTLPNEIAFGAKITPTKEGVRMELWLRNGTKEKLTDLRVQNCALLKAAKGFNAQTNDNKVLQSPFAACRSEDGKRWIITAWERCGRAWANLPCPCFHSDPVFPDCAPGETVRLQGWLSFYEGTAIEAEFTRIASRLGGSFTLKP